MVEGNCEAYLRDMAKIELQSTIVGEYFQIYRSQMAKIILIWHYWRKIVSVLEQNR